MMDVQDDRFNAVVPLPEDIRWHTVVDAVWGHAHQQSDKLALVASSLDGTVKRLTYEELAGRAEDVAAGLRERGIGKGDHVGIAWETPQPMSLCSRSLPAFVWERWRF
jgi:long-subunit acyl-CoA synthetase (AMP-forming)